MLGSSRKTLPEDARRLNRSLLLRALHHGGPMSRADLAKLVGLTPATVSAVINDDLASGLVTELGLARGNIGKPATVVGIAPGSRHVVTVGLSEPEQFTGAIVDLTGTVVTERVYARDGRDGEAAVELVERIADDMLAATEVPVLGVGVGCGWGGVSSGWDGSGCCGGVAGALMRLPVVVRLILTVPAWMSRAKRCA